MSTISRPVVKRQYGSRKVDITSILPLSSSSPRIDQLTKMSSLKPSSTQWDEALEDEDSGYGEMLSTNELSSSSPTRFGNSSSPGMNLDLKNVLLSSSSVSEDIDTGFKVAVEKEEPESIKVKRNVITEKKGDLRSFFSAVSPIKKRRASNSGGENDSEDSNRRKKEKLRIQVKKEPLSNTFISSSSSSPTASTSTLPLSPSIPHESKASSNKSTIKSKKPAPPKKFEQLFLDPFETSGHSTIFCSTCSMSYARTPDDMELHQKHHKRLVGGCDWLSLEKDNTTAGGRVLQDGIEWGRNRGGKIIMVDANIDGLAGKRVKDILSTIDTELSATSLTSAQLTSTKIFLFVTPQRKVIAAAVVQRIKSSFQVISSKNLSSPPSSSSSNAMSYSSSSSSPSLSSLSSSTISLLNTSNLMRFGEEEGAVFCSPQPYPTLLGIHRIWTSTTHRSQNLASTLLDSVAQNFIYGCPIDIEDRKRDVAFSQPTQGGMRLARWWTSTESFRVFVE